MYTKQTTVFIGMIITCCVMYPVESEINKTKQAVTMMELLCNVTNVGDERKQAIVLIIILS